MDSFFDGSFLKLLVPIIMVLLFSLPDLLRKRRKYPPKRPEKVETTQQQQPIPDEELPDIAKPRRPENVKAVPTATQPVESHDEAEEEPAPVPQKRPVVTPHPVPQVAAATTKATPAAVPHIVHGQPWGELPPEARDIYAGLVWSELLSPPVALRRKK